MVIKELFLAKIDTTRVVTLIQIQLLFTVKLFNNVY